MVGRLIGREGGLLRSLQIDCRLSTCILVFMKAISAHSLPLNSTGTEKTQEQNQDKGSEVQHERVCVAFNLGRKRYKKIKKEGYCVLFITSTRTPTCNVQWLEPCCFHISSSLLAWQSRTQQTEPRWAMHAPSMR